MLNGEARSSVPLTCRSHLPDDRVLARLLEDVGARCAVEFCRVPHAGLDFATQELKPERGGCLSNALLEVVVSDSKGQRWRTTSLPKRG